MKVYFACSIAGGRDHAHLYADLVGFIKANGGSVLSEMFANKALKPEVGMAMDPNFVWKRDSNWIDEADLVVADATQPSLGVGYEIALAESLNKPVLALFYEGSGRRLSAMIAGSPKVQVGRYNNLEEAEAHIKKFMSSY